jgi:hypothetical protein
MVAVMAVVLGLFSLLESLIQLKEGGTDFSSELNPSEPIIVMEIAMGSVTTGTDHLFRCTGRAGGILHGR